MGTAVVVSPVLWGSHPEGGEGQGLHGTMTLGQKVQKGEKAAVDESCQSTWLILAQEEMNVNGP